MAGRMQGMRVLVTGASSGIGRGAAEAFLDEGALVAGMARRADRLADVKGLLAAPADLTAPAEVEDALEAAAVRLGGLDVLVNAAGISRPGRIQDTPYEDWEAMFAVNVLGLLAVTRCAVPHLRRAPAGHVVNLSSMSGHRILSIENAVYGATKHAVQAIGEGLRRELQDTGVRVTTVSPSYVRGTEIHQGWGDPERIHRAEERADAHGIDLADLVELLVVVLTQPAEVQIQQLDVTSADPPR